MTTERCAGVRISVEGDMSIVAPDNNEDFSLEELVNIVGRPIEVVRIAGEHLLVVNEEGKLDGLPQNRIATWIRLGAQLEELIESSTDVRLSAGVPAYVHLVHCELFIDPIVGPALLVPESTIR